MKTTKYLSLAALALMGTLASCQNDDEAIVSDFRPADVVKVNFSVGSLDAITRSNPLATDASQSEFNAGDQVAVSADDQEAVVFQLQTDGATWSEADASKFLLWTADQLTFSAYYPVTTGTSQTAFSLPTDQSSVEKINAADYMTTTQLASRSAGEAISLQLERKMARVIVTISGFNDQYSDADKTVSNVLINSAAAAIADGAATGSVTAVTPYANGTGTQGTTYTALLIPATANASADFITLTDGELNSLRVVGIPALEAGKSYTYDLTVGKNKIEVASVTVQDWTSGETLTGGQAEEIFTGPKPITLAAKLAYTGGEIADLTDATGDLTTLAWAVGEHIAILYEVEGTKKVADAEITAVDGTTGEATIEFTVEDGTPDDTPCTLVYPLSAAKDDHTGVKDAATLLAAQDGTLNANLDVRVGEGTIQTTTPGLTVTTQPAAQFAIFKFTTKDESSTAIDVNSLTVFIGTQKYVITPTSATSELYAALPAVSSQTVSFSAAGSDSKNYVFAKDGVTFAASKYYQSPLTMTQGVHLATISGTSYTVTGNVTLMGTPNNNLTIGYSADNWEVTLDNVNPDGTKDVKISSNRHVNLKLKGTSRLTQIYANNSKNVTIDKAADDGTLILQIGGTKAPLDVFGTVYIKGGTVKARCTGTYYAVYSNLNITGGAVYLAGGGWERAVQGSVTGTLYGWNGSWGNYSSQQYATTDNTSGNPSSWTW